MNRPPPMPVSALLYSCAWMRLLREHAPWLVFPIMQDHRRDARRVSLWLGWVVVHYHICVFERETNVSSIRVERLNSGAM
jgi:hypothetical protein